MPMMLPEDAPEATDAALGRPEQVAARIRAFYEAGVRHLVLDLVGPYEERPQQIDGFARDVLPLLADLR